MRHKEKNYSTICKNKVMAILLVICLCISGNGKVIVNAQIDWGRIVPITQSGQVVDSITYKGVTVNAVYAPRSSIANYDGDATYCCAAFVSRFYMQVFGIGLNNLYPPNTPNIYSGSGNFTKTTTPMVGDIAASAEHWAIVKEVNGNQVTLIEQNCWNGEHTSARVGRKLTSESSYWYWHWSGNDGNTNNNKTDFFDFWGFDNGYDVQGMQGIWIKSKGYSKDCVVEVYLDDNHLETLYQDDDGYYSFILNTYNLSAGSHKLYATITKDGREISATRFVNNVNNKFFDFWGFSSGYVAKGQQRLWLKSVNFGQDSRVDIYLDDKYLQTLYPDINGYYSFVLNTCAYSQSEHKLSAILYENDLQITSRRYIHFSQEYLCSIDTPGSDKEVERCLEVRGWANKLEADTIAVNFYIDNQLIKVLSEDSLVYREDIGYKGGFSFSYDVSGFMVGKHQLKLEAITGIRTAVLTRYFWVKNGDETESTEIPIEKTTPVPTILVIKTVEPTPTMKVTTTPEVVVEPTSIVEVTATVEPTPTIKVTTTPEVTVKPTPTMKVTATPETTVAPMPMMNATATPKVTEKPTPTPEPTQKPDTVTKPDKVKLQSVKALGKKKLKVTWNQNLGVSGYQVQYALNVNFTKEKKTKNAGKSDKTKTLTGLKVKKYYYVRVRAYKKSGGKTVYGSWSTVKKCKVK